MNLCFALVLGGVASTNHNWLVISTQLNMCWSNWQGKMTSIFKKHLVSPKLFESVAVRKPTPTQLLTKNKLLKKIGQRNQRHIS